MQIFPWDPQDSIQNIYGIGPAFLDLANTANLTIMVSILLLRNVTCCNMFTIRV